MKRFRHYIKEEAGFPVNKGHAYEFVLAAAMISRFTDRYDDGTAMPVTPESVEAVMSNFFLSRAVWTVDSGDGVPDIVEFDGSGLPAEVISAMRDKKLRSGSVVKQMVSDAINAVNKNRSLTTMATDVITNGKEDDVAVVCGGTTGQMDTKSDVDVYINGREIRKVGFSVKYAGTKQAGQFAGVDPAKNLIDAFKSFDMDISKLRSIKAIDKVTTKLNPPYASRQDPIIDKDKQTAFGAVHPLLREIGQKFGPKYMSQKKNAQAVMRGLLKANIGKEDDVELIRTSVSFDKKTFDAISTFVMDSAKKNQVSWKVLETGNPTIGFYAGGYELFTVRFRYDADRKKQGYMPRFRVYVENGKYLDTLAASIK